MIESLLHYIVSGNLSDLFRVLLWVPLKAESLENSVSYFLISYHFKFYFSNRFYSFDYILPQACEHALEARLVKKITQNM